MHVAQVFAVIACLAILPCRLFAEETSAARVDAAEPMTVVTSFLADYCIACHDASTAEGDREFESFALPLRSESALIVADELIDQVTLRAMPPEDAEQPEDEQRVRFVQTLRASIGEAREHLSGSGGRTVMRRLSHREYENTLATLLDRRVDTLGLTADFPRDSVDEAFDNQGEALVTSGFLLDQYFAAANRVVELRLNKPKLDPQDWHFADNFKQYEELSGPHSRVFKYKSLCLYEQPNTDSRQGGYGHIEGFLDGVPQSGWYEVAVLAQAMHRDTHYDPKIFGMDFAEPFQLAVVTGDVRKGHIHYPQSIEPILDQAVVPDDRPRWLTFRVWLEAGQTPRFIFPNGAFESRESIIILNERYQDEFKDKPAANGVDRTVLLREGKLPHIRIDEVKIHGPVPEPGGGREEVAVFGPGGFDPDRALSQVFDFARRAYRRPLDQADRDRIKSLYQSRIDDDAAPRQAALDAVKLILCSPSFLYLPEITPEDQNELAPFDLASRLSYALWAAPPDDDLLRSAVSGDLSDRGELERHVLRMIDDGRHQAFVQGFLAGWLKLRDINRLPPPREQAKRYYAEDLPTSMRREAHLFFEHLLATNGPITDFIDADYTFVDKKLARHYDLPQKDRLRLADGFERVSLDGHNHRGGVLGMAGVLTVSANGVDTSPVTRGVWVMENILGIEPAAPPDVVPSIDANVSGAKTIREKLERHRQDAACNVCHRGIDPLGFALETFDPIGRWRTEYREKGKSLPVDPSGTLPSGESYGNFEEFKQVLLTVHRERFTEALIEKMLSYATGRPMTPADRFEIGDIRERVHQDNDGLRTLVTEVFTSEIFRRR